MTDPTGISPLAELAHGIQAYRNVAYTEIAGFTVIFFDCLLNFDSEIKLIWNVKGISMKVLYSLARYMPVSYALIFLFYRFGNFTLAECTTLYKADGALFLVSAFFVNLVLTIRTWAVWAKGKYITYILFGMYALSLSLMVVFYVVSLNYTTVLDIPGSEFGCYPQFERSFLPAAFIIHTVFDAVVLILMLIRGVSMYCYGKNSGLFRTIYSDGISFYVYNTAVSIGNVAFLFGLGNYSFLLLGIQGAFGSILACRVILNIRAKSCEQPMSVLPTTKNSRVGTEGGNKPRT